MPNYSNLTTAYTESVSKLNESQTKAVQILDGPLLVQAGPGSGKTHVLALRVGQILTESGMHAENILCLTFSRAGVASMKNKLEELLGSEAGKITVETFHSFADKVLRVETSTEKYKKTLLTKSRRYMILEKLLQDPKIGGIYCDGKLTSGARLGSIARIFDLLKKEGIDATKLRELTKHCIEDILPNHTSFKGKRVPLNEEGKKLKNALLLFRDTIAPIFESYQAILAKHNFCDYEDLLTEAINKLRSDKDLLLNYQIRYQYILVDEFQDTNEKQMELLMTLVHEVERPNLFVVGDDDQCIYRFQGASRKNFNTLTCSYPELAKIALSTNYRSTPAILSHAHALIKENEHRDPIKSNPLEAGSTKPWEVEPSGPHLEIYEDSAQEDYGIALKIKELLNTGDFNGSIAVLYRRNTDGNRIAKWLDQWGINYDQSFQRNNLLEIESGKNLLWLTRMISLAGMDIKLAGTYLAHWAMNILGRDTFLKCHLEWKKYTNNQEFIPWLEEQLDPDSLRILEMWNFCKTLSQRLEEPMTKEKLDPLIIKSGTTDEKAKEGWYEFLDSFLATDSKSTLEAFCTLLHYHEVRGIEIEYKAEQETNCRVILSTIWGSKGLEYDVVFVKNCTKQYWEEHTPAKNKARVPKLLNTYIPDESDAIEDLRRLIYVACTRAKCVAYFSFGKMNDNGKEQSITDLLKPVIQTNLIEIKEVNKMVLPRLRPTFIPVKADSEMRGLVNDKVMNFIVSPSSLYNWLEDTNRFFIYNICKVTDLPSTPLAFGSYVHDILEKLFNVSNPDISNQNIHKIANEFFSKYKYQFHQSHYDIVKSQAIQAVSNYTSNNSLPQPNSIFEQGIKATMSEGVDLYGKVDRLEETKDSVVIVDYKSGSSYSYMNPFDSEENPGDGHWRQAMIYRFLAEQTYPGKKNYEIQFHYIEQGKIKRVNEPIDKKFFDWISESRNEINSTFTIN
jgi:DNA helicase-2/ATP-dependent DNA helicase PcrA